MNKLFAILKFLFRKRLSIPSDFVYTKIKNFKYTMSENNVAQYNIIVKSSLDNPNISYIHPVYFAKISWRIILDFNAYLEAQINPDLLDTIVHQSEQIIIHQLPENYKELTVKSKIIEIKAHKKGTKFAIKVDYFSDETLIATEYSSGIMFGVKLKGEDIIIEEMPWPTKLEKEPIWTKTVEIDKNLPYLYAKKAEIDAPIHTNPRYAKSIGLPDIILQGTCSFAKSIDKIVCEELNSDFNKIKVVSARFTGHVITPNTLYVRLLEKSETALYFDVTTEDGKKIIKGGEIMING